MCTFRHWILLNKMHNWRLSKIEWIKMISSDVHPMKRTRKQYPLLDVVSWWIKLLVRAELMKQYGWCSFTQIKIHDVFPALFLASQCSPVIRKIRTDCASEFSVFERCLRENQSSAEACQPPLARFLACVETVDLSGMGKQ